MNEHKEELHAIEIYSQPEKGAITGTIVKINGVEIQGMIRRVAFEQDAGNLPKLIIELSGKDISLNTVALVEKMFLA